MKKILELAEEYKVAGLAAGGGNNKGVSNTGYTQVVP